MRHILSFLSDINQDGWTLIGCLVLTTIAQAKKVLIDKSKWTLAGVLADAATLAVLSPLVSILFATWVEPNRLEEIIISNRVLVSLALGFTGAMFVRVVFSPDGLAKAFLDRQPTETSPVQETSKPTQ